MDSEGKTAGVSQAAEALAALKQSLSECSGCALASARTQVVFGVGNPDAELMFVGEGPGFHEDKQGEPFVGQAGKLLTELLGGIGLARSDVYIANVVKCRPPENRDPAPEEIEACSPNLLKQIGIIRPRVICTLGRFATKLLTGTELSMTAIHGKAKRQELAGVPFIFFPVFHPAAALYAPANRKVLQEDFAKLRVLLTKGAEALSQGVARDDFVDEAVGTGAGVAAGEPIGEGAGSAAYEAADKAGEEAVDVAVPQLAEPSSSSHTGVRSKEGLGSGRRGEEQLPLW
jgi:uracil-DNA glycosylase family 4